MKFGISIIAFNGYFTGSLYIQIQYMFVRKFSGKCKKNLIEKDEGK